MHTAIPPAADRNDHTNSKNVCMFTCQEYAHSFGSKIYAPYKHTHIISSLMLVWNTVPAEQISDPHNVWPWRAGNLDSPRSVKRTHTPTTQKEKLQFRKALISKKSNCFHSISYQTLKNVANIWYKQGFLMSPASYASKWHKFFYSFLVWNLLLILDLCWTFLTIISLVFILLIITTWLTFLTAERERVSMPSGSCIH